LGTDIWAPVGWELFWARRTEKPILAYRAETLHTPAGQVFLQENVGLNWTPYAGLPDLRRAALRDLGRFLLGETERYGLTLPEIESLSGYLAELAKPAAGEAGTGDGARDRRTGAAGGGVILAPGKDEPPKSRLLGS
jgi:hypothetical protein